MAALQILGDWLEDSGWTNTTNGQTHSSKPRVLNVQGVIIN